MNRSNACLFTLLLAAGLAADHPNDPAMRALYLDALVAAHEDQALAHELAIDERSMARNLLFRIAYRRDGRQDDRLFS